MISLDPEQLAALATPLLQPGADGSYRPSSLRHVSEKQGVALVRAGMLHPKERASRFRSITPAGVAVVAVANEIARRGLVVQSAIETYKDGSFSIVVMLETVSVIANAGGFGVVLTVGEARTLSTHSTAGEAFDAALAYLAPAQAERAA